MPSRHSSKKLVSNAQLVNIIKNYHEGRISKGSVEETQSLMKIVNTDIVKPLPSIAKAWKKKKVTHEMLKKCHEGRKNFPVVSIFSEKKQKKKSLLKLLKQKKH